MTGRGYTVDMETSAFTRAQAIDLIRVLHDGQMWDEAEGVNYVYGHLIPVMHTAVRLAEIDGRADVEVTACAALLHDSIEDVLLRTTGSLDKAVSWLITYGVPKPVVDVVVVVTMLPGETRAGYMTRVAADPQPEVRCVKVADNLFNSDPESLARMALTDPARAERLDGKYRRDRAILAQANRVIGHP